jgi:lysophospholipase L1-like esterase
LNIRILVSFLLVLFQSQCSFPQGKTTYKWWTPANSPFHVIEGQAWPDSVESAYDRLPQKAEKMVRKEVWNLSEQSAGLLIRFKSDAGKIKVKYIVKGNHDMPHMPATGVSGVDLYAKNSDGKWLWCKGNYSFGDTIKYTFANIDTIDPYHDKGREYHLYLPLYNTVEWMRIGVPEGASFEALPLRQEKPIVVYGTSIAQGACASRPGTAWTSLLGRKMDRPLINLGFSGNGRLEAQIIDLMAEIDAKIYILDCLPNLTPDLNISPEEAEKRILASVKQLRNKRPTVPILLVEHAGYSDGAINKTNLDIYTNLNKVMRKAYAQLKSEGINELYLLSNEEIGLDIDSYVDGIHPSDQGMQCYAKAYEKCLRNIFNELAGTVSTAIPVTQNRDADTYDWGKRHQEELQLNKSRPPAICFIGNAITHFWGGLPEATTKRGSDSWNENFEPANVRNYGFGWDRIENVLWRVYHDELDGFYAKQLVILIGTNNLSLNTDQEIIEGLKFLIQAVKGRQPKAGILLLGIFPARDKEKRIHELNGMLLQLSEKMNIEFTDAGNVLLNNDGKINESFFTDGLHPTAEGYKKLAPLIKLHLVPGH